MQSTIRSAVGAGLRLNIFNRQGDKFYMCNIAQIYATAWTQARRPIPCFGTTHADSFHGSVPVTGSMNEKEIEEAYEENTGHATVRAFRKIDPAAVPNHGPFAWGRDAQSAAHNAVILEAVARMACFALGIDGEAQPISRTLHDKHFLRKHGSKACYGQPGGEA